MSLKYHLSKVYRNVFNINKSSRGKEHISRLQKTLVGFKELYETSIDFKDFMGIHGTS
jgi:hypothetical protein